jgi:hypothetical protein
MREKEHKMIVTTERKLVTLNVSVAEIEEINALDFANVGEHDTIVDLDTYHEFVEEDVEIIETVIAKLKEAKVEADVVQFFLG